MSKILCLIDCLGSGGAERQISYLAFLLKGKGHDVKLMVFTANDKFYERFLIENGVTPEYNENGINRWVRIIEIKKIVRAFSPDLVIAYKDGVCIAAILAKIFCHFKLVVSERTTTFKLTRYNRMKFFLYRFAEWIVPNSESQAEFIKRNYPNLASKIRVIRNTIDTNLFTHGDSLNNKIPIIITTATIYKAKNTKNLIEAAKILKERGVKCIFNWYGKRFDGDTYADEVENLIKGYKLNDVFRLKPASSDVQLVYRKGDIFCLPSIVEGFPNVICEAMASGLPIVCSNVCDNQNIVHDSINGLLFDPNNPEDIADKIQQMIELSPSERKKIGLRNRNRIIELCSQEKFVASYLSLI